MKTLPPEGWGERHDGQKMYTKYGATFLDIPPSLPGWRCYFVARHGHDYTTWIYRREEEKK